MTQGPGKKWYSFSIARIPIYFILLAWTATELFILIWMTYSSFKTNTQIYQNFWNLPTTPNLNGYYWDLTRNRKSPGCAGALSGQLEHRRLLLGRRNIARRDSSGICDLEEIQAYYHFILRLPRNDRDPLASSFDSDAALDQVSWPLRYLSGLGTTVYRV